MLAHREILDVDMEAEALGQRAACVDDVLHGGRGQALVDQLGAVDGVTEGQNIVAISQPARKAKIGGDIGCVRNPKNELFL